MPNNNPSGKGGHRFKKGRSGNPKGSSAKARAMGQLRRLTADVIAQFGSDILLENEQALQDVLQDPEAPMINKWMASLVKSSMLDGDPAVFNALLNRITGKVQDRIEHTGPDGDAIHIRALMTVEELEQRSEQLRKARLEVGDD